jgi:hypothetical protein
MSIAENIKFNKKLNGNKYQKYTNFDAIEVPFTDAIPNDHKGLMGVPISFLDKYNPEQFEIIGSSRTLGRPISQFAEKGTYSPGGPRFYLRQEDGKHQRLFDRIVIRHLKK